MKISLTARLVRCLAIADLGVQVFDFSLSVESLRISSSFTRNGSADILLGLHISYNIFCTISTIMVTALCIER